MTLPVPSFAALPGGTQPLSLLDQQFTAIAQSGCIECTASGNNTIALTPITGQYSPTSNTDGAPVFVWTQQATNTGPVTINVAGIGPFQAYKNYGQQPITTGDLAGGGLYSCAFLSSLAGGAGGYVTDVIQAGGLTDAPSDGFDYGRKSGGWDKVLALAGGTMTGPLNLAGDPTIPQQAATKAYVDAHAGGGGGGGIPEAPTGTGLTYGRLSAAWSPVLNLGGGTMTGPVTLFSGGGNASATPPAGDNSTLIATTAFVSNYVPLIGGVMAGPLTLVAGSTASTPAATDNSTKIATTAFVAAKGVIISDTPPPSPAPGQLWWDSVGALMYMYYQDPNSSQWVNINNYGNLPPPPVVRSYLAGLTLSTAGSSATFAVAAGVAADSTNSAMMNLPAAMSKTTAAWALGTGGGALDTGAIANSTWYHVFEIQRTDTGVVDVLISLSATAPALPSPYTLFRRIGSMRTNASGQWTLFTQIGDRFRWAVPVLDIGSTSFAVAYTNYTLSVPLGVRVRAFGNASSGSSGSTFNIKPTDAQDGTISGGLPSASPLGNVGANATGATTVYAVTRWEEMADVNGQIAISGNITVSSCLVTCGWFDRRGQDN